MLDEKTRELIAVGAAITANCQPCLDYHAAKALALGAQGQEITAAIEVGQQVRRGASRKMDRKIDDFSSEFLTKGMAPAIISDCDCQ